MKIAGEDALRQNIAETKKYIEDDIAGQQSLVKDTVGWTGKNLLKNEAITQTVNGVTFTVNADKSVTVNGTATADAVFVIHDRFTDDLNISAGAYIGNGITNGVSGKQYIRFFCTRNGSAYVYGDIFNGEITINVQSGDIVGCLINIASGQTVSNLTFYPMLRKADIIDPTYEPYHESVEEEIEQIYADNGVLGAKNLLPNNAKSQTINGVTFTVNADGSITANGTASADSELNWFVPLDTFIVNETYILSGCPIGGALNRYTLDIFGDPYNDTKFPIKRDLGNGISFTIPSDTGATRFKVRVWFKSGQVFSNLKFYPMVRLASDPDDTYQPYAMTNRELTEEKINIADLKTVVSASSDFADFKTRIASL